MGSEWRWIGRYLAGMVISWWLWQGGVAIAVVGHEPRVEIRVNVMLHKERKLPRGHKHPNIQRLNDWLDEQKEEGVDLCTYIKAFGLRFVRREEDSLGLPPILSQHPYLKKFIEGTQHLSGLGIPIKCAFGMGVIKGKGGKGKEVEQWGEDQKRLGTLWQGFLGSDMLRDEYEDGLKRWREYAYRGTWGGFSEPFPFPISGTDVIVPFMPDHELSWARTEILEGVGVKDISSAKDNRLVHCAMLIGAIERCLAMKEDWLAWLNLQPRPIILDGPALSLFCDINKKDWRPIKEKFSSAREHSSITLRWSTNPSSDDARRNAAVLLANAVGEVNFVFGPELRRDFEALKQFRDMVRSSWAYLQKICLPYVPPIAVSESKEPSMIPCGEYFPDAKIPRCAICLLFRKKGLVISGPGLTAGRIWRCLLESPISQATLNQVIKFAKDENVDIVLDFSDTECLEEYHGEDFVDNVVKRVVEALKMPTGTKPGEDKLKLDTKRGKPEEDKSKGDKLKLDTKGNRLGEDKSKGEETEEKEEEEVPERSWLSSSGSNCEGVPKFRENRTHLLTR